MHTVSQALRYFKDQEKKKVYFLPYRLGSEINKQITIISAEKPKIELFTMNHHSA